MAKNEYAATFNFIWDEIGSMNCSLCSTTVSRLFAVVVVAAASATATADIKIKFKTHIGISAQKRRQTSQSETDEKLETFGMWNKLDFKSCIFIPSFDFILNKTVYYFSKIDMWSFFVFHVVSRVQLCDKNRKKEEIYEHTIISSSNLRTRQ